MTMIQLLTSDLIDILADELQLGDEVLISIGAEYPYPGTYTDGAFRTGTYYDHRLGTVIDREVIARFNEVENEGYLIHAGREAETERWDRPFLYRVFHNLGEEEPLGDVYNIEYRPDR